MAGVPGVDPDDVNITLEGDTLTISGEMTPLIENVDWVMVERHHGRFYRSLQLNVPIAADKVDASFKDGILTLVLPKAEEVKPKRIKVTSK